ncbi:MAG: aldolase [Gammaproteobacteria bacterium]|nr:aldolase [Gammaproteobacteria bacterium]
MTEPTLEKQQRQVRSDLAAMFRLTAHFGWDDTVWNHITARVPGSEHHFYMHHFGQHYSEVTASSLITVDEDGNVIDGPPDVNTAGFIIHSAVHLNHADSKFVFHAHPPSAIAATALEEIPFLVQDSSMLYGKVGYHQWEGLSVDPDERFRIAERLVGNSCLIMRNHGLLTVGATAGECFMNMYYLIRMCEVALQLAASNIPLVNGAPELWAKASEQYQAFPPGQYEWPALKRICGRLDPSYED